MRNAVTSRKAIPVAAAPEDRGEERMPVIKNDHAAPAETDEESGDGANAQKTQPGIVVALRRSTSWCMSIPRKVRKIWMSRIEIDTIPIA